MVFKCYYLSGFFSGIRLFGTEINTYYYRRSRDNLVA